MTKGFKIDIYFHEAVILIPIRHAFGHRDVQDKGYICARSLNAVLQAHILHSCFGSSWDTIVDSLLILAYY